MRVLLLFRKENIVLYNLALKFEHLPILLYKDLCVKGVDIALK